MKRKKMFPWWGWIGGWCFLVVAYVSSSYVVMWVVLTSHSPAPEWLMDFYFPVGLAAAEWEWFGKINDWFLEQSGISARISSCG
jgi:hypothetical protein